MGEPLLYHDFDRIVDICKKYGVKLNLTTNGTWPRKKAQEWAEILVPVASDIKISWNSASPSNQKNIMRGSSWNNRILDLQQMIMVRDKYRESHKDACTISLQATFMEMNLSDLPDLIKMAIELGVDRVKGHHLWVHNMEMKEQNLLRNQDSRDRWNQVIHQIIAVRENLLLPNGKKVVLDGFESVSSKPEQKNIWGSCRFLGREAWINTEGRFDVCCAPDELRQSLGHLGSVKDKSFMEIWKSEKYNHLLSTYSLQSLCVDCTMRKTLSFGIEDELA